MNRNLKSVADEEIVIGTLLNGQVTDYKIDYLMFYDQSNKTILIEIELLRNAGLTISPELATEMLREHKLLDHIGGVHRINYLSQFYVSDLKENLDRIKDAYVRRKIIAIATMATEHALVDDLKDLLNEIKKSSEYINLLVFSDKT